MMDSEGQRDSQMQPKMPVNTGFRYGARIKDFLWGIGSCRFRSMLGIEVRYVAYSNILFLIHG